MHLGRGFRNVPTRIDLCFENESIRAVDGSQQGAAKLIEVIPLLCIKTRVRECRGGLQTKLNGDLLLFDLPDSSSDDSLKSH